jgi:alcohol dehydrogenase (NADP+)
VEDGDADALLAVEDAPVVLTLTPPSVHADVTETALRADRHVYTEKPLATTADRTQELVALAADRDSRLGCAPVAPFADPWLVVRRYLAEGRLGDVGVVDVTCHLGRPSEWHDDPDTILRTGPLLGGVYPLTLPTAGSAPSSGSRQPPTT